MVNRMVSFENINDNTDLKEGSKRDKSYVAICDVPIKTNKSEKESEKNNSNQNDK